MKIAPLLFVAAFALFNSPVWADAPADAPPVRERPKIESNGSISPSIMPDALHLSEAGYKIWANAIEPRLKELLGEK